MDSDTKQVYDAPEKTELYFYSRILGFKLADQVEPVDLENL